MNDFTPPIFPKLEILQLIQLASYYEELFNYHQRLADIARLNLNSVKDAIASAQEETGISIEDNKLSIGAAIASPHENNGYLNKNKQALQSKESPSYLVKTNKELMQILDLEFKLNRGKILNLDYLMRAIYGQGQCEDSFLKQQIKSKVKDLLQQGQFEEKWHKVPDSPNCWTLNLEDIPDLKTSQKSKGSKQTLAEKKRQAIVSYLQEIYPNYATIQEIVNAIYSKKFSLSNDRKFYHCVQQILYAHNNKLWTRVAKGLYISRNK